MPRGSRANRPVIATWSIFRAGSFRLKATVSFLILALLLCHAFQPPFVADARQGTPESAPSESLAGTHLDAASAWLRAQQDDSGGFPGFSGDLDPGTTTDAVIALYATRGSDPEAGAALDAAVGYLEKEGTPYAATGAGQAAKLALAAVAGGRDPRAFGGIDLVAAMKAPPAAAAENPIPGIFGDDLYDHAIVLIAFAAAGEPVSDDAVESLRATQGSDGGWAFDGSIERGSADSNTTALVIQALVANGQGEDQMVSRAVAFLPAFLAPDEGGFAYGQEEPLVADANSTALVTQALIAAGQDPASPKWGNVMLALTMFQTADGGLRYMASDEAANLLATLQAIPALAGLPLPVAVSCGAEEIPETDGCVPLALAA